MKILMVYPEYPPTFWSFKYALAFIRKKAAFPPLGLITVAAMLPADWEIRLTDLNIEKLGEKDIEWADMAMVGGMIVQEKSAREVITRLKAAGLPVIAGGPLFTPGPDSFPEVDTFILGEGETTVPLFLADLARGQTQRIYEAAGWPSLESTPSPRWDLVRMKAYNSMPVQYSRGCPFNCEFCDIVARFGHVPRLKTDAQMLRELDALHALGWRGGVFIVDDNFIGNPGRVKGFLRSLSGWLKTNRHPFNSFFTEVSINLADDPELMRLMREADFNNVFIGIETPDEEGLQSCGKLQNLKGDLLERVKTIQHNGMGVWGGFILGFDTDRPGVFDRMAEFIRKSGIVTAMVGLLTALPKTRLYDRLKSTGRLIAESDGNNTSSHINFIPKMDVRTLVKGYQDTLAGIFHPKEIYGRIVTFLREYRPVVKHRMREIRSYFGAFFKTVWKLGIRDKGRIQFWKMILWTLTHRPRLIADAIVLAVYGYHFRRMYGEEIRRPI